MAATITSHVGSASAHRTDTCDILVNLGNPEPYANLIIAQESDCVREDVKYEGIASTLKKAHAPGGSGLDIEYPGCNPTRRYSLEATRNNNYWEVVWVQPDIARTQLALHLDGYQDKVRAVGANACADVPTAPGLGVEYS